jgi:hypothetical protein
MRQDRGDVLASHHQRHAYALALAQTSLTSAEHPRSICTGGGVRHAGTHGSPHTQHTRRGPTRPPTHIKSLSCVVRTSLTGQVAVGNAAQCRAHCCAQPRATNTVPHSGPMACGVLQRQRLPVRLLLHTTGPPTHPPSQPSSQPASLCTVSGLQLLEHALQADLLLLSAQLAAAAAC